MLRPPNEISGYATVFFLIRLFYFQIRITEIIKFQETDQLLFNSDQINSTNAKRAKQLTSQGLNTNQKPNLN